MDQGVLSSDSHRQLGRNIKQYFHRLGIHSATVQIEYCKDSGKEGSKGNEVKGQRQEWQEQQTVLQHMLIVQHLWASSS